MDLLVGFHDDNGYETTGIPEDHNILEIYERDDYWSANDLVDAINNGAGFIHHSGHANTNYVMKLYNSDITDANFYGANGEDHNYTFIYTHGCNCGGFDASDCIAEAMVCIENFAIAGAFNSRYGWFNEGQTEGPSQHLHREFVDALFNQEEGRIWKTHMISKIETSTWVTAPGQHEEGALRWCFYGCNILGDPVLSLWTDEPIDIEVDYPAAIPPGTPSIAATGMSCSLMAYGSLLGTGITDDSGNTVILIENGAPSGELELVVAGLNCLPHNYPVSVPVGIGDRHNDIHGGLYPNPADGHFTLAVNTGKESHATISIYRLIGDQPIYESSIQANPAGESTVVINTHHWLPGVYVCRIKTTSSEEIIKLVIRH
jgi:hypothetical protein